MRILSRALLVTGLLLSASVTQAAETATVFGAASLKNALDNAGKAFTAQTGIEIKASYAASSALARQIESGAPADLERLTERHRAWFSALVWHGQTASPR